MVAEIQNPKCDKKAKKVETKKQQDTNGYSLSAPRRGTAGEA